MNKLKTWLGGGSAGDPAKARNRQGLFASLVGVATNTVLFVLKLIVGIVGKSVSILGDAINNLSDTGASVVTLAGFQLSKRPADKEHPYGHARYEYVSGLVVAMLIVGMGAILCKTSIDKIKNPEAMVINTFTYVVIGLSLVFKVFQFFFYRGYAKRMGSPALKAASWDAVLDVAITLMTLLVSIIYHVTSGVDFDGVFGAIIAVVVMVSGIRLIKETIDPLIGMKPDKALVKKITDFVLSHPGILGVHDVIIHSYGATIHYATADVEVPKNQDLGTCHQLIDSIERDACEQLNILLTLHIDPVEVQDARVNELREQAKAVVKGIDGALHLHDFHLFEKDGKTQVLFDVCVPFESKLTEKELVAAIVAELQTDCKEMEIVVRIDRE